MIFPAEGRSLVLAFFFCPEAGMDYKCDRWQRLRERILRRDKRCRETARYSPMPPAATVVHHVFPAEDYPGWAWEPWNLIGLSERAHNAMHDRRTGKLTELGLAWQRRVSPPSSAPAPW